MPGIDKKDGIRATKKLLVWEPSQPADAILDKASLALAKGMSVNISKGRVKEHPKVSAVKISLQQEIMCSLESSTNISW